MGLYTDNLYSPIQYAPLVPPLCSCRPLNDVEDRHIGSMYPPPPHIGSMYPPPPHIRSMYPPPPHMYAT